MEYLVNNIYESIQGEGVKTGIPMVLLRLHGCKVGCPWCDTKETWVIDARCQGKTLAEVLGANQKYTHATPKEIGAYIQENFTGAKWVLITGGEPATKSLKPLVDMLHKKDYQVALETSGTATGHIGAGFDWVCVSPKINMPGRKSIIPQAVMVADEIKHVVGKVEDIFALDTLLAEIPIKKTAYICLQPVSQSQKATKLCIETVQRRGWRLSIQIHKYLGLP